MPLFMAFNLGFMWFADREEKKNALVRQAIDTGATVIGREWFKKFDLLDITAAEIEELRRRIENGEG